MAGLRVEVLAVVTGTLLLVCARDWERIDEAPLRSFYATGRWGEPSGVTLPGNEAALGRKGGSFLRPPSVLAAPRPRKNLLCGGEETASDGKNHVIKSFLFLFFVFNSETNIFRKKLEMPHVLG